MREVKCRIGIDLGGTKIEAIVIGRSGEELVRQRVSTPQGDYRGTVEAIRDLVESVEQQSGLYGSVGVGIPGTGSPATGLVKNANSTALIGNLLDRDLEEILARPVRLANDANCFALSEAVDGAAVGADNMFGVILGTGVGGGIVINGRVVTGVNAVAGEWGHNPLPWPKKSELPGPECYCGKTGCIETFLSGPALQMSYYRTAGVTLSADEIADRAQQGEHDANMVMEKYEHQLARGLATVINLMDPEVIVLGGGLSNIDRLYPNVKNLWGEYVFSDEVRTDLMKAKHGDSSGVRGAAWLWSDKEIWEDQEGGE
ncbi:MAG: ROK family protein [Gammaproteobacteria bacterium]|uniref:ROK family protein n=1 Tax=Candidatus Thiopontia autotrophica TaxID=2841688 RepID=A0A8J6TX33_9GAMM|nr:ROK family protein [Candidatus Thiopontia autotrophica]